MNKEPNEEQIKAEEKEEKKILPTKRQIIIETDGNIARFTKLDVAGNFELLGILQGLINAINNKKE